MKAIGYTLIFLLFSPNIHAKSMAKYYKYHQPKGCETLNRSLSHVNKLLSFSDGKEYKEKLKEKKALMKLRKDKGC